MATKAKKDPECDNCGCIPDECTCSCFCLQNPNPPGEHTWLPDKIVYEEGEE